MASGMTGEIVSTQMLHDVQNEEVNGPEMDFHSKGQSRSNTESLNLVRDSTEILQANGNGLTYIKEIN